MRTNSDSDQSPLRDLLQATAAGARYVIVALGEELRILTVLPERELLSYAAAELPGRSIADVLGVAKLGDGTKFLRDRNGSLPSVRITTLVPSAGMEALLHADSCMLLMVAEVPEAGLLLVAVDREASGEPLAEANRALQEQAAELRSLIAVMEERNREMTEELTLAADLQRSLLPGTFPEQLPVTFAHKYVPYAFIGGDFFDVLQLDDDHLGVIIADVSGHSVPAAFVTAMLKGAFATYALRSHSPAATLSALNRDFFESIHTDHYITAFYTVLDMTTLELIYSSVGHPKQLLCRASGECEELSSDGFFVGTFESTVYGEATVQLAVGDRIVYCTDGILEVEGNNGDQFGRRNLRQVIEENTEHDIDTLSASVISELIEYMVHDTFHDDITLLSAEVVDLSETSTLQVLQ